MIVAVASADPTATLAQYGALGVITLIALGAVRVLFNREVASHQRDIDRADAEHLENLRLNALIIDKVLPAVLTAGQAIAASAQLLQSMQYSSDVAAAAAKSRKEEP